MSHPLFLDLKHTVFVNTFVYIISITFYKNHSYSIFNSILAFKFKKESLSLLNCLIVLK